MLLHVTTNISAVKMHGIMNGTQMQKPVKYRGRNEPQHGERRRKGFVYRIEQLWSEGQSDESIAEVLGITRQRVSEIRRMNGMVTEFYAGREMVPLKEMPEGVCFKCGVNEKGHKCGST